MLHVGMNYKTGGKDAHCYTISGHNHELTLNYIHQFHNNYRKQTKLIYFPIFCHWRAFIALTKLPRCKFASGSVAAERHTAGLRCCVLPHATLTHARTPSPAFPRGSSQGNRDSSASRCLSVHLICPLGTPSLKPGGLFNSLTLDMG